MKIIFKTPSENTIKISCRLPFSIAMVSACAPVCFISNPFIPRNLNESGQHRTDMRVMTTLPGRHHCEVDPSTFAK